MRARVAVAAFLKRTEVELELRTLDVVAPVTCEDRAVTPAACRGHAVEGVAAVLHAGEDVVDRGDAEHGSEADEREALLRLAMEDPPRE